MKQKPEKIPTRAILLKPFRAIGETFAVIAMRWLGWWYCRGCDKLHSPRVVRYRAKKQLFVTDEGRYCSLTRPPMAEKDERG